jgi:diguanylate cyclase (GGDEF)-like protein
MASDATIAPRSGIRLREFANLSQTWSIQTWFVAMLVLLLMAAQAIGLLLLGTGSLGFGVAEVIVALANLLALACVCGVYRRAHGTIAIFWFLFILVLVFWLVPTAWHAYDTLFNKSTLSDSTWRLLFCLYGAPILMMLFLPRISGQTRPKFETFLDLFQIGVVIGLIYSTFFFIPAQHMLPDDALLRNVSISNVQSLLLLVAVLVRLPFAQKGSTRTLLQRLAFFLLFCAVATFIGYWIDLHGYLLGAAWFHLAWTVNQALPAFIALTWKSSPESESDSEPISFGRFLAANLILVAMLVSLNLLRSYWKQANGDTLTDVAMGASLLAFTFRLALTQFHQQKEIAQRKAAQAQLTASNGMIVHMFGDARRQSAEMTQISELGSLLHACSSQEEVFRLVPERMRRLFPGASGCISLLSPSKNRVERVAKWGIWPTEQMFLPDQCWALRRGATHAHSGGQTEPRCSHLLGEGASICIPLIANGEIFGTFSIQNNDIQNNDRPSNSQLDADADAFTRHRQLATTVAEHIALATANLGLRESLRLQAIRDPLTGLYNRRYMQEFLDRELRSARRKQGSLSILMLDLDHFKRYNDKFGHTTGDSALAAVGQMLLRSVRTEDIACRFGGEEFAVILPECNLAQALVRAEDIRKHILELRIRSDAEATELSFSIGVSALDETTDRFDLLLEFADEALYRAKREGRNRVVAARPAAALPESSLAQAAVAPSTAN